MLVDSHCHLNYKGVVERQAEVLASARAAGVGGFLNISTRQSEWADVIAVADRETDVWACIGIHPHEADQHPDLTATDLLQQADHPRVIALGETGLDYHYDHSDRARQQTLFRLHISVARQTGLPVVIHTRDAEEDTLAILREELGEGAFTALIHCFTGTPAFGRAVLDLGLAISISGIVTFKNARELQDFAREIPADRLLVETDSPFLAPVPHRGKMCEPAYVRDTAQFVATLRSEPLEQLAGATTRNFHALFTKAVPAQAAA
ncbi:LuxR family transcriptional regulator [Croceibacterium mercuriale]|uniref:LuxR family transcriptional regulator n=1 Tax=Croceibacterium mercuriale TaxID=1572751 RepID=A0A0B2BWU6_9SPHN|nr:TatD family hydrolase [Croceibacterium mercuriale]KHL25894.1 LuxR family transcriptional regulator [Croceibacterium mercuriale]